MSAPNWYREFKEAMKKLEDFPQKQAPAIDPRHAHTEDDTRIFVFGSNLQGIHGGGAAWYARNKLGAELGVAEGRTGRTYALPTCSVPGVPLSLPQVEHWVNEFLKHANEMLTAEPATRFFVSPVGCGIAGFDENDIIPMFRNAPENCDLPPGWRDGPVCNARCRDIGTRHWEHSMG